VDKIFFILKYIQLSKLNIADDRSDDH